MWNQVNMVIFLRNSIVEAIVEVCVFISIFLMGEPRMDIAQGHIKSKYTTIWERRMSEQRTLYQQMLSK